MLKPRTFDCLHDLSLANENRRFEIQVEYVLLVEHSLFTLLGYESVITFAFADSGHGWMQPQVSSATVNLTTNTAIVWPLSEAKTAADWQRQIGEMLANHLTNCGFQSNMRGLGANEADIQ
ncbi:Copper-transporting ATPase PAA1, chloroplastic-like protein [Drosera capensis]